MRTTDKQIKTKIKHYLAYIQRHLELWMLCGKIILAFNFSVTTPGIAMTQAESDVSIDCHHKTGGKQGHLFLFGLKLI